MSARPRTTEHDGVVPAGAWRRMHPVTPALKGWKVLIGAIAVIGYQVADDIRAASDLLGGKGWLIMLGVVALVALVGFGYSAIAWRMTRYAVTDEAVHLRTGVLFRQQRQARLDRLQAVDVVQPLLARMFGLADLRLEVAGGSGSAVSLAYLREPDAQELRSELLALAAGLRRPSSVASAAGPSGLTVRADGGTGVPSTPHGGPTDGGPADGGPADQRTTDRGPADGAAPGSSTDVATDFSSGFSTDFSTGFSTDFSTDTAPRRAAFEEAPEREVYAVPMDRLLVSTLRSATVAGLVVVVIAFVVGAIIARDVGPLFVLFPAALGFVGTLWNRVNSGAAFRAALSPDGIRLRHGLTEQRAQTVPPGRVQAVRLSQGLWWRGPDWWRIEINVAGYGTGNDAARATVLHPVATRDEAAAALWLVLPDLGVDDPRAVVDAAMSGRDDEGGFTSTPRRARWLDPVAWRRQGVRVTRTALVARSGRLTRHVVVVPHERTQSLGLEQGPLQRRLGVASFVVHSTPGPVRPRVDHLDGVVAAALLDEQSERARTARAAAGPELWMRPTS